MTAIRGHIIELNPNNKQATYFKKACGVARLAYKGESKYPQWGKTIKELDRFYPSSKTCSCCSFVIDKLPLTIRYWTCPNCQTSHDRDINASINILNKADKVLTLS